MSKSLVSFWLSIGGAAGLLMASLLGAYGFALLLLPLAISVSAFYSYSEIKYKKLFVLLASINFLVGVILYFFPHAPNSGLRAGGVILALFVYIPTVVILYKVLIKRWRLESGRAGGERGDS